LHEALARFSALGLGAGMLCACACAYADRRTPADRPQLDRRLLPIWCGLTLVPIAGIAASQLLLFVARVIPAWRLAIMKAMRHSVFWHLGFWEWAGSAAIFLFLVSAAWLLPGAEVSSE
jgi:hypothetical protein